MQCVFLTFIIMQFPEGVGFSFNLKKVENIITVEQFCSVLVVHKNFQFTQLFPITLFEFTKSSSDIHTLKS